LISYVGAVQPLKSDRLCSGFGWRWKLQVDIRAVPAFRQNAPSEEAAMRLRRSMVSALVFIAFGSCAQAEGGPRNHAATNAAPAQTRRPVLTGKERLGPKWTDEQRIDNCNVPFDKRGNTPRPSACTNSPSS
jgi:hypothetical protein